MLGQGVGEAHALGVPDIGEGGERLRARPGHAAHAARREPAALLIRPGDDLDRPFELDAAVMQRAQHLEPRDHAIDAVEPSALRLAVHMAAGQHRRGARRRALRSGTRDWPPRPPLILAPASSAQPIISRRASRSSAVSAWRLTPSPAMAPISGQPHEPGPLPGLIHGRRQSPGLVPSHSPSCRNHLYLSGQADLRQSQRRPAC